MNAEAKSNPTQIHTVIKLGIDVHFKWFYVGRQFDVATLQPIQKIALRGCCSDFEWIVRVQNGATFGATTKGTVTRQEGSPEIRGHI